MAVKAMKDPVQARDPDGNTKARICGILDDSRRGSGCGRGEVRFAKTGNQRQPRGHFKSVTDVFFDQPAGYRSRGRAEVLTGRAAIRKNVIKVVALVLGEPVHSHLNVVVLHRGYV